MIEIRKNLESHKGQGVVWSSKDGPRRGRIEDVQVTYPSSGGRQVVFIVESNNGDHRRRMTQFMLYPNMTAWLKHQVDILEGWQQAIRDRNLVPKLTENLYKAIELLCNIRSDPEAVAKLIGTVAVIDEQTYQLCDLHDPIESHCSDAELLDEIDDRIRQYTRRQRERRHSCDSYVAWRNNHPDEFEAWKNRRRNNGKA